MIYEHLEQLLGAYYHEDFEDVWPAFELYLRDANGRELRHLITEIEQFLRSTPRSELVAETRRLGSCVYLGEQPEPYVEWLEEMGRRADKAVGAAAPR